MNIGDRCLGFITPILTFVTNSYMDSVVLIFLEDEVKYEADAALGETSGIEEFIGETIEYDGVAAACSEYE